MRSERCISVREQSFDQIVGGQGHTLLRRHRALSVRTGFISVREQSSEQFICGQGQGFSDHIISGQGRALSVRTGFYSTRCEASGVSPSEGIHLIRALVDRGKPCPYGRGLSPSKGIHLIRALVDRDEPCPYGRGLSPSEGIHLIRALADRGEAFWINYACEINRWRTGMSPVRTDGVYLRPRTFI